MSKDMYHFDVHFEAQDYFKTDFFDIILQEIIKMEEIKKTIELSLAIVSDKDIQKINSQYRKKDTPTDVLSFRDAESDEPFPCTDNVLCLGEVFISRDTALVQAKDKKHSYEHEVAFLFVHGVLHLLDYDHERSQDEEKIMFEKTDYIMDKIKDLL